MQAYLQYRYIRKAVRRQLDDLPDRARASLRDGITDGLDPSSSQTSSSLHRQQQDPVSHGVPSPLAGVELLEKPESHGNHSVVFLVGWDHDEDPMNPRNFTLTTRVMATLIVSALAFVVSAASSIESAVLRQNSAAYNVSEVVASLATGIFLLGFAAGSLVSGPLSEILGRNIVYTGSTSLFMIFVMASGLAPNIGAQLAFRFLAGVFGCPPLTCAGGTVADLWDPLEKTLIFPLYAILSFGGAVLSPVIASYMGQGALSWRWTNWIVLIMAGLVLGLVILLQPETYSPLLLKWKAHHLRQLTGDPRYQSKLDLDRTSLLSRITTACGRQFTLAIYEPIILLLALYMTILYIVLFTFFDGYTHIFSDVHDLSQGLTNIIWVAMYVGIMLAGLIVPGMYSSMRKALKDEALSRPHDNKSDDNGASSNVQSPSTKSSSLNPENRLWYAMIGAPAIPISLFWMGWTDYKNISVWSPIVGSSLFGFGSICMFISSYMYVIDAYEIYAASALGFMTVTRYCAAGGMTVVGVPFYNNVGVQWTLTILGIISAVMVPVPYIFWKFGKVIRGWSRYAV
ncbi:major facilitator superfamily domain-containing protein [Aspergillus caelatus]|uniref:Major facilitator superfamily domain-containing protein n=1 Tax=Aspergillus caelatus TaxID=61420 RepID=A0A5N7A0D8_9EURO|nr:major facilitator superfamily domain-containing protein [Aspergillus caelatus]KAE8362639.1 major facilitator superfamily domain-containing protein [Aspergillus caelatus]